VISSLFPKVSSGSTAFPTVTAVILLACHDLLTDTMRTVISIGSDGPSDIAIATVRNSAPKRGT
jgi:hypothetical protein